MRKSTLLMYAIINLVYRRSTIVLYASCSYIISIIVYLQVYRHIVFIYIVLILRKRMYV